MVTYHVGLVNGAELVPMIFTDQICRCPNIVSCIALATGIVELRYLVDMWAYYVYMYVSSTTLSISKLHYRNPHQCVGWKEEGVGNCHSNMMFRVPLESYSLCPHKYGMGKVPGALLRMLCRFQNFHFLETKGSP